MRISLYLMRGRGGYLEEGELNDSLLNLKINQHYIYLLQSLYVCNWYNILKFPVFWSEVWEYENYINEKFVAYIVLNLVATSMCF